MNKMIQAGDCVRHKTMIALNGGPEMSVVDVEGDQAKVAFFHGPEGIHLEKWFPMDELVQTRAVEGGFLSL